jgi:hypothetical protein
LATWTSKLIGLRSSDWTCAQEGVLAGENLRGRWRCLILYAWCIINLCSRFWMLMGWRASLVS